MGYNMLMKIHTQSLKRCQDEVGDLVTSHLELQDYIPISAVR